MESSNKNLVEISADPTSMLDHSATETVAKVVLQIDKQKIQDRQDDINTLLLVAGLFSAVLTPLLVESYHALRQDPMETVILVLRQIAQQTDSFRVNSNFINATTTALANDTRSSDFKPTSNAKVVNILWFSSLVVSLATASFCITVNQWLREYLSEEHVSPLIRLRIRHLRYHKLSRWQVLEIAGILPFLLQASLTLFLAGLCLFTLDAHQAVGDTTLPLVVAWGTFFLISILTPIWWPKCPYKTPFLQVFRILRKDWEEKAARNDKSDITDFGQLDANHCDDQFLFESMWKALLSTPRKPDELVQFVILAMNRRLTSGNSIQLTKPPLKPNLCELQDSTYTGFMQMMSDIIKMELNRRRKQSPRAFQKSIAWKGTLAADPENAWLETCLSLLLFSISEAPFPATIYPVLRICLRRKWRHFVLGFIRSHEKCTEVMPIPLVILQRFQGAFALVDTTSGLLNILNDFFSPPSLSPTPPIPPTSPTPPIASTSSAPPTPPTPPTLPTSPTPPTPPTPPIASTSSAPPNSPTPPTSPTPPIASTSCAPPASPVSPASVSPPISDHSQQKGILSAFTPAHKKPYKFIKRIASPEHKQFALTILIERATRLCDQQPGSCKMDDRFLLVHILRLYSSEVSEPRAVTDSQQQEVVDLVRTVLLSPMEANSDIIYDILLESDPNQIHGLKQLGYAVGEYYRQAFWQSSSLEDRSQILYRFLLWARVNTALDLKQYAEYNFQDPKREDKSEEKTERALEPLRSCLFYLLLFCDSDETDQGPLRSPYDAKQEFAEHQPLWKCIFTFLHSRLEACRAARTSPDPAQHDSDSALEDHSELERCLNLTRKIQSSNSTYKNILPLDFISALEAYKCENDPRPSGSNEDLATIDPTDQASHPAVEHDRSSTSVLQSLPSDPRHTVGDSSQLRPLRRSSATQSQRGAFVSALPHLGPLVLGTIRKTIHQVVESVQNVSPFPLGDHGHGPGADTSAAQAPVGESSGLTTLQTNRRISLRRSHSRTTIDHHEHGPNASQRSTSRGRGRDRHRYTVGVVASSSVPQSPNSNELSRVRAQAVDVDNGRSVAGIASSQLGPPSAPTSRSELPDDSMVGRLGQSVTRGAQRLITTVTMRLSPLANSGNSVIAQAASLTSRVRNILRTSNARAPEGNANESSSRQSVPIAQNESGNAQTSRHERAQITAAQPETSLMFGPAGAILLSDTVTPDVGEPRQTHVEASTGSTVLHSTDPSADTGPTSPSANHGRGTGAVTFAD